MQSLVQGELKILHSVPDISSPVLLILPCNTSLSPVIYVVTSPWYPYTFICHAPSTSPLESSVCAHHDNPTKVTALVFSLIRVMTILILAT